MGMFDTIKVDSSLLPVEDDEKTFLQGKDFQTKSFNNFMDDYEITGGGELLMYYYKLVNYDTEIKDDDWTGMFGRAKRVLDRKSKVDYHGIINFYYYELTPKIRFLFQFYFLSLNLYFLFVLLIHVS